MKKDKDPTTTLFDDDEWIRSLTEAQEITADILEERVTYDQEGIDPKFVSRRLLAPGEGDIAALRTSMRQLGVGSKGGAEPSPFSTSSSTMNGRQEPLSRRWLES